MSLVDAASLPGGRLLGVDLGSARIGLALTDPDQVIATPLETLDASDTSTEAHLADQLATAVQRHDASGVVIGSPRTLAGREGRAAARARRVAAALADRHELPVALVDERFTTVEAARVMRNQDVDARDGRGVVDQVAAALILQHVLDRRRAT